MDLEVQIMDKKERDNTVNEEVLRLDKLFKQLWFNPNNYPDPKSKFLEFGESLNNFKQLDFHYACYLVEMLAYKLGYKEIDPVVILKDLKLGGGVKSNQWHRTVKDERKKMLKGRLNNARYSNVPRDSVRNEK